ncbi:substrate-binding periplasmic protein [Teredinibacter sp. KSP-S5-2]|uniref:substrate-binding periplasmic protein n=1 Tax=Teredinibacter sp. KSP-S5-2 TaxID=3034506 RepID=UPI0029350625|nr:transporter substrate-binding domain-containing protein [Teredinibacter sp. KSP-S5-2]WNO07536.1 transporter substrate-binding domain-containing protein [Teredinibacter sp. KSP-S5-2]
MNKDRGLFLLFWLSFFWFSQVSIAEPSRGLTLICDDWPPYQIVNDGKVGGFSVAVVDVVFKRMEVNVQGYRHYPWKRAITMLEKGMVDGLFSANKTPEREVFAYYPSEPLVDSPWVVWAKQEDELEYKRFDDLLGRQIGLVRGYSYTHDFWQFVEVNKLYMLTTSDEQNFKMLNAGRIDFTVAELGNALHVLKKNHIYNMHAFSNAPIKVDGLYVAFSKERVAKEMVERFSEELKKLKAEPLYQKLYEEFFSI